MILAEKQFAQQQAKNNEEKSHHEMDSLKQAAASRSTHRWISFTLAWAESGRLIPAEKHPAAASGWVESLGELGLFGLGREHFEGKRQMGQDFLQFRQAVDC
jgi:hypothetical protein